MQTTTPLPSVPLSPKLLRLRLAAAVRRFGAEDAIHVLDDGNEVCSGCHVEIARYFVFLVHRQPIWCEYCARILVSSHAQRQTLLALFAEEVYV